MYEMIVTFAVFFPICAGAFLLMFPESKARTRNICTFTVSLINLAAVLYVVLNEGKADIVMFSFTDKLKLAFAVDDMGKLFAMLVSILWPFSLLYAYEYMEHDKRQCSFFAFFTMTLGSVIGIAFSKDLFSMYIFYEVLTLVTFPLVMHEMSPQALIAGAHYLVYMLGGAAFAFVGMIVVLNYSDSLDFTLGGVIQTAVAGSHGGLLLTMFFVMFVGFSVKAAMMPFGKWIIEAAVAPMPVTGLLHAVAVVKAGAFASIRLIYYIFGAEFLRGTWPQYVLIGLTSFTILYGSSMAVKELHLKRRLAYSTISNLSYVLFGALLMTPQGLEASLAHLIMHAVTKIGLFFCIGALMHTNNKVYQYEIDGIGKKMGFTFTAFALCGLSLIGVPQFGGFISKMKLLTAVIGDGGIFAYIGGFAIIISALLTAIYLLITVLKAFFPEKGVLCEGFDMAKEAGVKMLIPIYFAAVMTIVLGFAWKPLLAFIDRIAGI